MSTPPETVRARIGAQLDLPGARLVEDAFA
jgi:hypothetical protein